MSLKLCGPKNILDKKGVLMLRHICYDTNGSALKASGTLMDTLPLAWIHLKFYHSDTPKATASTGTKYDCPTLTNLTARSLLSLIPRQMNRLH